VTAIEEEDEVNQILMEELSAEDNVLHAEKTTPDKFFA